MTHNIETSIRTQIGENAKNGIYEVFINHQDYYSYYGLGISPTPTLNQKMFQVIWDNSFEILCLDERRAWSEFKAIAEEEGVAIAL